MTGSTLDPAALDALRRLAYLDGDRVSVQRHLSEAREQAQRDIQCDRIAAAATAAEQALAEVRTARRHHEAHLQDLQTRLARSNQRLDSGQLTTQREVSAAEAEIQQIGAAIAETEEQLLEVLVGEETSMSESLKAKQALAAETPMAEQRKAAASAQAAELESRIKQIDLDRREAAQRLPHEVVERYRSLFPRTGGRPFALASKGECENCRKVLPASVVQMLRTHTSVPACPSCGHLLIEAS